MKVKSESEVAQSYLTLRDPVDCSLPGSSIHGIFQAIELFPIEYEYASAFYNGEALVCKAGEFYYIDINGNKTRKYNPLNL